jgi:hypothetical protein
MNHLHITIPELAIAASIGGLIGGGFFVWFQTKQRDIYRSRIVCALHVDEIAMKNKLSYLKEKSMIRREEQHVLSKIRTDEFELTHTRTAPIELETSDDETDDDTDDETDDETDDDTDEETDDDETDIASRPNSPILFEVD